MADTPKLDLGSCVRISDGLEENLGTQKISVLDHLKGFQYKTEQSDNFIIDMETFSNGTSNNKQIINNSNSRITLQRSLSRKGSSRGGGSGGGGGGGGGSDTSVTSSSPRASLLGPNMPEKALLVATALADHSNINPQVNHQITINTAACNINASTDGKFTLKRNSFKRTSFSWGVDPKRVLFFFATLSSMGSIVLIYFTLLIGKFGDE